MPTSPLQQNVIILAISGELVAFLKGPMWASAPTDRIFVSLKGGPGTSFFFSGCDPAGNGVK
jgi:hypothetical protein